ncbi:MAG: rhamnulokinase [Duncaniella sp.]|nr:rhamnulokinase [Duncaniella sp.]MDE6573520.1 rhamnulokinase [Duncaniella sp.]
MKTYHLAVDLGATSGRTILASFDGEKVDMEELTRFKYPMLPLAGHLFWNLPYLYAEIINALKAAGEKLSAAGNTLSSIGIDTWGCDVAYFYADGTIAGLPYCYRDPHTAGAVEEFAKKMPKREVYEKTGIQFMDFNTLFQLDTLRRNGADVLDSCDKILWMPDALAYMLTGNAVTEYTVASTAEMLNPATGDLDTDILKALGLDRSKFGPMVQPGAVIGSITSQVQEATGLGAVPVVAVAGHDTASAVIGVPTPDENYAYLSCGTWSLLGIESPHAIINDRSYELNFTNEGGIDGTTRFLKNICGLWIFERVRTEMGLQDADISALAASCLDSDCNSIINPDDPSFANPTSMVEAINEYCRVHGEAVPVTTADYVRVVYRSLAHRVGEMLALLKEMATAPIKRLHVIGGGSRNVHLMDMLAQETGLPVVAGPAECTALGNVLVQLRASGRAESLAEMRRVAINSTETKTFTPK